MIAAFNHPAFSCPSSFHQHEELFWSCLQSRQKADEIIICCKSCIPSKKPEQNYTQKLFHSERVKYCDVDTEPYHQYAFSRIAYNPTYSKIGIVSRSYGVNIDLYPIISLPNSEEEQDTFFEKAIKLQKKRSRYIEWKNRIINRIPITNIPGFRKVIRDSRDYLFNESAPYGSTDYYYIIAIPHTKRVKVTYRVDLLEDTVLMPFENKEFMVTKYYEKFLKQMYGNYLQLPPEEERHPYHGGFYYFKIVCSFILFALLTNSILFKKHR